MQKLFALQFNPENQQNVSKTFFKTNFFLVAWSISYTTICRSAQVSKGVGAADCSWCSFLSLFSPRTSQVEYLNFLFLLLSSGIWISLLQYSAAFLAPPIFAVMDHLSCSLALSLPCFHPSSQLSSSLILFSNISSFTPHTLLQLISRGIYDSSYL